MKPAGGRPPGQLEHPDQLSSAEAELHALSAVPI